MTIPTPSGRLLALGDVHGCAQALEALLEVVNPQPEDTLVALGDFVDRGPDSCRVVELMRQLHERCQFLPLLGNHEQMLLDVLDGALPNRWLPYGATATLESYGFRGDLNCIPQEHVAFFRSLLPYVETDEYFFVHANYDPKLPLDEQPEELLRWTNLRQHLPGPHVSGKIAIVGHTAHREGHIVDIGHLRCIDTCCYGGLWLTLMDVAADRVWQADPAGNLRLE